MVRTTVVIMETEFHTYYTIHLTPTLTPDAWAFRLLVEEGLQLALPPCRVQKAFQHRHRLHNGAFQPHISMLYGQLPRIIHLATKLSLNYVYQTRLGHVCGLS